LSPLPVQIATDFRVRRSAMGLNLLSDAAEPQPLICVVDDEQWLDRASAQVLGFVARRLVAESIGTMNGFCLAAETLQRS
jgi:predicted ATPase